MSDAPRPPDWTTDDTLGPAFYRTGGVPSPAAAPPEPARRVLRRFARRALVVLLVIAAADWAVRAALPPEALLPWMDREVAAYTVKVARFAAAPAPDVVFLGNSRVHDGLVPEVFAQALGPRWGRGADRPVRVYNLGLMNAKAAEFAALVRDRFPDPPPRRVIFGISGTEFANVSEFQYASRFLWNAAECRDYLARTPFAELRREHVENWMGAAFAGAFYTFAQRDALEAALADHVRDALGLAGPPGLRATRALVARYNRLDALSPDGTSDDGSPQPCLADALARGDDVRVPPYSLGDARELVEGSDYPLMRAVLGELRARGVKVAIVEVPPSPWLQGKCPEFHGDLFRRRMAEFASSVGVPFVPMPPSETFLSDASYVDANHLNRAGARRFSSLLLQRLQDVGYFDG